MANITPDAIFPNMTTDGTSITIPLTDLVGLTLAEAEPATGDGRELARIIFDTITSKIEALPVANRPTRMSVAKSNIVGISATQYRQTYSSSFDVNTSFTANSLVPEPVA
jgi:hypothetical protein